MQRMLDLIESVVVSAPDFELYEVKAGQRRCARLDLESSLAQIVLPDEALHR